MTTVAGRERCVPEARAFIDGILGRDHPHRDDARLLISELVTNAVQHTRSRLPGGLVTLIVVDLGNGIRVEVIDEGTPRSVPVVREDVTATNGRGLLLVQTIAAEWGYQGDGESTTVWFRLED